MATVVASLITFTFISTPAHAENINEATVSATCESVTITAPANARVIFSVDSEPPSEVDDGATTTKAFYPGGVDANLNQHVMDVHHWGLTVIVFGSQTSVQAGDVSGCAPGEPQPSTEPTGFAATVPAAYPVVATAEPVVPATVETVTMRLHSPW